MYKDNETSAEIAARLLKTRENVPRSFQIVYGFSGRFRTLGCYDAEMNKFSSPQHSWRIIGKYTKKVDPSWVADDIQAFLDEAGSMVG